MTPASLYAALDEPDADVDYILGLIADWYAVRGDERREAAARWMVAEGKRPDTCYGWFPLGWRDDESVCLPVEAEFLTPFTASVSSSYLEAIDALADQWPAVVAEWWERERMVTT